MTTPANEPEFSAETIRQITDDLSITARWVKFLGFTGMTIAIIVFASGGLSAVAGVTDSGRGGGLGYVIAGLVFAVVAVIWIYPSRKLLSYGRAIAKFQKTQSLADLLSAIDEQKAFWRVACIAVLALGGAGIVAIVVDSLG